MHDVVPLRNTPVMSPEHPSDVRVSPPDDVRRGNVIRTLATLAVLLITLPIDAVVVALALLRRASPPAAARPTTFPRTVLITGGKMTKALHLARCFHRAGHRVILAETAKYRFTGHRFSRAVDAFYCIPDPADRGYDDALYELIRYEAVDNFIPVSSPAASVHDARARYALDGVCEVMHAGEDWFACSTTKPNSPNWQSHSGFECPTGYGSQILSRSSNSTFRRAAAMS